MRMPHFCLYYTAAPVCLSGNSVLPCISFPLLTVQPGVIRVSNFVIFPDAASHASSASCPSCWQISVLPSLSRCLWSPGRNSVRTYRASTRCPVTMHDTVQLQCDVCGGYGMAIPAYLTGNPVIFWIGMDSAHPRKSSGRRSYQSTNSAS